MTASPTLGRSAVDGLAGTVDPVWSRLRTEAEAVIREEPQLASFIVATLLNHATLEGAVAHRVAARLGHPALPSELVAHAFHEAIQADPRIGEAFRADIVAVMDRDPATSRASGAGPVLQGLPRDPGPSAGAPRLERRPARPRALPAEPVVGGVPMRHPPGCADRPRHLPRPCHRPRRRLDRSDRGRRLDPARGDARRHRQAGGRPSPEDPPRRDDRSRRQDPRQHRGRGVRAGRGGLGGAAARCRPTRRWSAFRPASSAPPAAPSRRGPWISSSAWTSSSTWPKGSDARGRASSIVAALAPRCAAWQAVARPPGGTRSGSAPP